MKSVSCDRRVFQVVEKIYRPNCVYVQICNLLLRFMEALCHKYRRWSSMSCFFLLKASYSAPCPTRGLILWHVDGRYSLPVIFPSFLVVHLSAVNMSMVSW